MQNALTFLCLTLLLCTCGRAPEPSTKAPPEMPISQVIDYWDTQRKGANFFNEVPQKAWLDAAAEANIRCIRLVYDKWDSN